MSLLGTIRNTLTTQGGQVNNTQGDLGVGALGVGLTSNTTTQSETGPAPPKDLEDLIIVKKTISNARRAVEIDPTTWSSVISTVILSNQDYEIVGDDDADPRAVKHIKKKAREWKLPQSLITTTWKGIIDGRCFIQKYITPGQPTIQSLDHLAYNASNYNFLELVDPYTGLVVGYKQKAEIYPIPSNWEVMKFDQLANRQSKTLEKTFTPDKVVMPRLLQSDGNSEGFVYKVLDDVYILKSLKNMMPRAAKMAATTLGVQVGDKDFPFQPYNTGDTYEKKKAAVDQELQSFSETFQKKEEKETIIYTAGVKPGMVGDGRLVDLNPYIDVLKQDIRAALLTPDSRFESSSSNRAVSQEQMSGSMGQTTVIGYIQDKYQRAYYEPFVFDHELTLNGYEDSVGLVHLKYGEQERGDELTLAQVAEKALQIKPDLDQELLLNTYFPSLAPSLKVQTTAPADKDDPNDGDGVPGVVNNAVLDPDQPAKYVTEVKKRLEEEGMLI